jgi:hypothetical protein
MADNREKIKELLESIEELSCSPDGNRYVFRKARQALALLDKPKRAYSNKGKDCQPSNEDVGKFVKSIREWLELLGDNILCIKRIEKLEADLAAEKSKTEKMRKVINWAVLGGLKV